MIIIICKSSLTLINCVFFIVNTQVNFPSLFRVIVLFPKQIINKRYQKRALKFSHAPFDRNFPQQPHPKQSF